MEHYYSNIHGWFNYEEFYSEMVRSFPDNSHFVEVGVWQGKSAVYMAVEIINSGKKIKFDCVDSWEFEDIPWDDYGNIWTIFQNNIEPVKNIINPIKSISWEGSKYYDDESLDFVFIDASHDYESVKKDLHSWYPKIKKGGIISGHDYDSPTVSQAVNEYLSSIVVKPGQCWSHIKQ